MNLPLAIRLPLLPTPSLRTEAPPYISLLNAHGLFTYVALVRRSEHLFLLHFPSDVGHAAGTSQAQSTKDITLSSDSLGPVSTVTVAELKKGRLHDRQVGARARYEPTRS